VNADAFWFWVIVGSGTGVLTIIAIGLLVWINSKDH
jgi:hypothetical protein